MPTCYNVSKYWLCNPRGDSDYRLQSAFRLSAVLLVVIFHLSQATGNWLVIGNAGTDASFVLSGFTIWSLAARHRQGGREFLTRRASRIVPLYWAETLLFTAVTTVQAGVQGTPGYSVGHVVQSLLLVPHLDARGTIFPVVNVAWSLTIELLFYGLVASSFLLPRGARFPALLTVLVSLSACRLFMSPVTGMGMVYTSNHMAEIAGGVLVAQLRLSGRVLDAAASRTWIACGLSMLIVEQAMNISPYDCRWAYAGVPAVIILAGVVGLEAARGRTTRRFSTIALLGGATYPMYLFHGLFLRLVRSWVDAPVAVQAAALVALTLLFGLAVQPVDTWLTGTLRRWCEPGGRRLSRPAFAGLASENRM